MSCGAVIVFLFSGVGATLIGVAATKLLEERRYARTPLNGTTSVVTPRSEPPIVYQPIYVSPPPSSTRSLPSGEPLPYKAGTGEISNIMTLARESAPEPNPTFQWRITDAPRPISSPALDKTFTLNQSQFNSRPAGYAIDPWTFHFPESSPSSLHSTVNVPTTTNSLGGYLVENLNFDPQFTKLVNFADSSIGVADHDKFIYGNRDDGVLLASSFDPDKWEQAEFIKKEDEITFRLTKKGKGKTK